MPYVKINDERLYYSDWDGDAQDERPPLVLVHGAGGTHLHWPPQLRRLRDTDVYGLDLPGHGHSRGQGQDSIAAYRELILAWAEALSLRRFVLVGHSMGGAIGQEFALHYADRLAGLVLVSRAGAGVQRRTAAGSSIHPAGSTRGLPRHGQTHLRLGSQPERQ
jgi:pimeloyl-ACP methyl ester carboxylesterase